MPVRSSDSTRGFALELCPHRSVCLVFQDSMSFMYQALERNLRVIFTGSSQRPKKHVSSPLASYFSTRPYGRLGW